MTHHYLKNIFYDDISELILEYLYPDMKVIINNKIMLMYELKSVFLCKIQELVMFGGIYSSVIKTILSSAQHAVIDD